MKTSISIFITIFSLLFFEAKGQKVVGFWQFTDVKVGNETMTPVAKWTKINKDHTFTSGNGWLQNAIGTWTYDKKQKTILPIETNGFKDEFGAFSVHFENKKMIWEREEEGMKVVVTLEKTDKMPMAPADKLKGIWKLTKASDLDLSEIQTNPFIFIRWDRIYKIKSIEGSISTGYWHINGHRPEITLLSHKQGTPVETWNVSFQDDKLVMKGISDTNKGKELTYQRTDKIP